MPTSSGLCRAIARWDRRSVLLVAVPLAAFALAGAAEWSVDDDGPSDFRSIQEAINAPYVLSGDTVRVRPGLYPTNLYLAAKDLAVVSERGPLVTILDGGGSGSVVSLQDRTSATRIEGFTIRNGRDQTGGGVFIVGGAPVVTRNIIEGNSAVGGFLGYGYGGGIEIYGAAPSITRNIIRGNTALDGGGGIDVYYAGPSTPGTCCPVLAHNTIVGNAVTATAGVGGGILSFASEPSITATIVQGNRAGTGGGIYVYRVAGNNDEPAASEGILHANVPDEVAGDWRLPASNLVADPRLGPGEGIDLWPRSDSPALDAAGPGTWPDLRGAGGAADGDLDGAVAADIGAIESLGETTGLMVAVDPLRPDTSILTWDGAIDPSVMFNVYGSDGNPFRDTGGTCLASVLAEPRWEDGAGVPLGGIRYYLVTGAGVVEGSRGLRSDGTLRPATPSCGG